MTITKKSIAYAFPSSSRSIDLGFEKQGCYFVQLQHFDIEGSGQCSTPFLPHNNVEGFLEPDNQDMILIFLECDGEIDNSFLRYGNPKTLLAILKAVHESKYPEE